MRIAIFGGTFDPVHSAHIEIARAARQRFSLDRVLLIPAGNPPHKSGHTAAAYPHRLRMVELAVAGEAGLEASDLEAGNERSYSIHTIGRIRAQLEPEDRLFFLIGADAFAEIQTWHRWREVLQLVEFIVVSRPGAAYPILNGARVHRIDDLEFPVSSSGIRQTLAAGSTPPHLPPAVLDYIREFRLYQGDTPPGGGAGPHPECPRN